MQSATILRMPLETDLLTVKQAARILQVTKPTIRDWLRGERPILRGVKIGRGKEWRVPKVEIERMLRGNGGLQQ